MTPGEVSGKPSMIDTSLNARGGGARAQSRDCGTGGAARGRPGHGTKV